MLLKAGVWKVGGRGIDEFGDELTEVAKTGTRMSEVDMKVDMAADKMTTKVEVADKAKTAALSGIIRMTREVGSC